MAKSLLPRTVDPVAAWLTLRMGERCRREHRAAKQAQLSRAEKVRRSLIVLKSTAPTRKLEGGQCAHACSRAPSVHAHPSLCAACTVLLTSSRPRPFGRIGARPRPEARQILAPQQAAVLRDKEEQAASHERALVDQQPGIGALHRLHELDAPFPDEWAPPFPIGFAFLCPSSRSQHSQ